MKQILAVFFILVFTGSLYADGKFYSPPDTVPPGIPYQRAMIAFDGKKELMILQSKYEGDPKDFGWVVPLPSVPELAHMRKSTTYSYLFQLLHGATKPEDVYLADYSKHVLMGFIVILIYLGIKILVLRLLEKPMGHLPKIAWAIISVIAVISAFVQLSEANQESEQENVFYSVLIIGCIVGIITTLIISLFFKLSSTKPYPEIAAIRNVIIILLIVFTGIPFIQGTLKGEYKETLDKSTSHLGSIEVLMEKRTGIYEAKVIKAKDGESLIRWMKENGYRFEEKDKKVFDNYIKRDWCFLTAKVAIEESVSDPLIDEEKMVRALVMRFNSNIAVYPLALTGTIGTDTEITLYVFDFHKIKDSSNRLRISYAGRENLSFFLNHISFGKNAREWKINQDYLTKLEGQLSAEEMSEDLYLINAYDDEKYREVQYHVFRQN